jgi:hypothetical protein
VAAPGKQTAPVRATQSFVGTLSSVWSRPSLVAIELTWRWIYGIPALLLVLTQVRSVYAHATHNTLDPATLGLPPTLIADPVGSLAGDPLVAAAQLSGALARLLPGLERTGLWLVPLLFCAWVVASGLGRAAMFRRADPRLTAKPLLVMVFHAARLLMIALAFWIWFAGVSWAARIAITQPTSTGAEPNLVLYCALVIVLTLGLFTGWNFAGWLLSVAPVVAMARNLSLPATVAAAWRLGPLRGKLVEINLVMGIVKIALIVLAMVFTATPLPFESSITGDFLLWWWLGVMVLYVLASDFFHVARLIGYLQLYRRYQAAETVATPFPNR